MRALPACWWFYLMLMERRERWVPRKDIHDCLSSTENLCSTQHLGSKRALNLRQAGATYSIQTDTQWLKKGVLHTHDTHTVLWRCHKRSCLSEEGCTLVPRVSTPDSCGLDAVDGQSSCQLIRRKTAFTRKPASPCFTPCSRLFPSFLARDLSSGQEGGSRAGMTMTLPKDNLVGWTLGRSFHPRQIVWILGLMSFSARQQLHPEVLAQLGDFLSIGETLLCPNYIC